MILKIERMSVSEYVRMSVSEYVGMSVRENVWVNKTLINSRCVIYHAWGVMFILR